MSLRYILALFYGFLSFSNQSFAASDLAAVEKVLSVYQKKQVVEMSVVKEVTSELLGKKTSYEGQIWLSKEKFRWETNKPEKSLLLFDGVHIFSVQYPSKELGGNIQVAKGKADKRGKSHLLISLILKKDLLAANFATDKVETNGDLKTLKLLPKTKDISVVDLFVTVDTKKQKVVDLKYKDEIGNLVELKFGPVYFDKPTPIKDMFKFIVPKDAQVTEL